MSKASQAVDISLILQEAKAAGAKLTVRGDKLVVGRPAGVVTMDLLQRIRDNKAGIIARLNETHRVLSICRSDNGPEGGDVA